MRLFQTYCQKVQEFHAPGTRGDEVYLRANYYSMKEELTTHRQSTGIFIQKIYKKRGINGNRINKKKRRKKKAPKHFLLYITSAIQIAMEIKTFNSRICNK
jgi:hypothetical protein